MYTNCQLAPSLMEQIRRSPVQEVLQQIGHAAVDRNMLHEPEFKKLIAYLLEIADGRDRREPWTTRAGEARPVPRLRIILENAFGRYADLEWFKLNKTTNNSGMPLTGLFPRVAAGLARVNEDDFAEIVRALISANPDAALLRILQEKQGRIPHMGLELFSRLAFAFRSDLYFLIPKAWGESSGCLRFIGNDLRRSCAVSRAMRDVCDDMEIDPCLRGPVVMHALNDEAPHQGLTAALNLALGPSLARFTILEPADAYVATGADDDLNSTPLDFAARSIRARRGDRRLRARLLRLAGNRCAISGTCPIDLLEVAYVVPFPTGDMHGTENAILLRADLHTLWDLNLLGIDPKSLTVQVSTRLADTMYEHLAGKPLLERTDRSQISIDALQRRWKAFVAKPKTESKIERTAAPDATPGRRRAIPGRSASDLKSSTGSFAGIPSPSES